MPKLAKATSPNDGRVAEAVALLVKCPALTLEQVMLAVRFTAADAANRAKQAWIRRRAPLKKELRAPTSIQLTSSDTQSTGFCMLRNQWLHLHLFWLESSSDANDNGRSLLFSFWNWSQMLGSTSCWLQAGTPLRSYVKVLSIGTHRHWHWSRVNSASWIDARLIMYWTVGLHHSFCQSK